MLCWWSDVFSMIWGLRQNLHNNSNNTLINNRKKNTFLTTHSNTCPEFCFVFCAPEAACVKWADVLVGPMEVFWKSPPPLSYVRILLQTETTLVGEVLAAQQWEFWRHCESHINGAFSQLWLFISSVSSTRPFKSLSPARRSRKSSVQQ